MAKAPKPKPLPVNTETIGKAAETNAIKALVALASAYNHVALDGPFTVNIPAFVSGFVGGTKNQYRKVNISVGDKFTPTQISLGKKCGMIFAFEPVALKSREGQPVVRVEINWSDLIDCFGDLADKIEARINRLRDEPILVSAVDEKIKTVISKNPSMHKILTQGFSLAQAQSKIEAQDDRLEEIPGFGTF